MLRYCSITILVLGRCYPIRNTKVALPQQISDLTIPNVSNNPRDSQSDSDVNDDELEDQNDTDDEDNEDIEFDPY